MWTTVLSIQSALLVATEPWEGLCLFFFFFRLPELQFVY